MLFKKSLDFAKSLHWKEIVPSVITAGVAVAFSVSSYLGDIHKTQLTRYQNTISQEYKELRDERLIFTNAMSKFTSDLATGVTPDKKTLDKIDSSIIELHIRVDFFATGLPEEKKSILRALQKTLGEVKHNVIIAKKKDDLNQLTGALKRMQDAYWLAAPVIVGEAGKPEQIL